MSFNNHKIQAVINFFKENNKFNKSLFSEKITFQASNKDFLFFFKKKIKIKQNIRFGNRFSFFSSFFSISVKGMCAVVLSSKFLKYLDDVGMEVTFHFWVFFLHWGNAKNIREDPIGIVIILPSQHICTHTKLDLMPSSSLKHTETLFVLCKYNRTHHRQLKIGGMKKKIVPLMHHSHNTHIHIHRSTQMLKQAYRSSNNDTYMSIISYTGMSPAHTPSSIYCSSLRKPGTYQAQYSQLFNDFPSIWSPP